MTRSRTSAGSSELPNAAEVVTNIIAVIDAAGVPPHLAAPLLRQAAAELERRAHPSLLVPVPSPEGQARASLRPANDTGQPLQPLCGRPPWGEP